MKNIFLLIVLSSFFYLGVKAQEEAQAQEEGFDLGFTQKQINDVYLMIKKTDHLSAAENKVIKLKESLPSLNDLSLEQIEKLINLIDPSEIRDTVLSDTILNQINKFADDYMKNISKNFQSILDEKGVTNKEIAISNTKGLLKIEMKLVLNSKKLTYNEENYTREEIIQMLMNKELSGEKILLLFGANVDEPSWDKKVSFLLNNLKVNLFPQK